MTTIQLTLKKFQISAISNKHGPQPHSELNKMASYASRGTLGMEQTLFRNRVAQYRGNINRVHITPFPSAIGDTRFQIT